MKRKAIKLVRDQRPNKRGRLGRICSLKPLALARPTFDVLATTTMHDVSNKKASIKWLFLIVFWQSAFKMLQFLLEIRHFKKVVFYAYLLCLLEYMTFVKRNIAS